MENKKYVEEFLRETEFNANGNELYPSITLTTLNDLNETRSILSDRQILFIKNGGDINNNNNTSNKCICARPNCKIFCTACEQFSDGRIRLRCKLHPNTVYLMDLSCCTVCHAGQYMLHEVGVNFETLVKQSAQQQTSSNKKSTQKRYLL